MKKTGYFLAILAFSAVFSGCNGKQEIKEDPKTITVRGTSKITNDPDMAVLTFSVTTTGWSAKNISQDNETIATKFTEAVKAQGVSPEDIVKSNFVIENPGNTYESKRNIVINLRNINNLPQVVDCKTAQIKLKSIEYKINDTQSLIRQARTQAIKNAQDIASLLAGASGSKTGRVLNISDDEIKTVSDASGKITISTDTTVTFELQ